MYERTHGTTAAQQIEIGRVKAAHYTTGGNDMGAITDEENLNIRDPLTNTTTNANQNQNTSEWRAVEKKPKQPGGKMSLGKLIVLHE